MLILNEKSYVMPSAKGRVMRKVLALNEKLDFTNLTVSGLDELVSLVVDIYGNQFNLDELYDGIEASKLIPTLIETIQAVTNGLSEKLDAFPKKDQVGE